MSRVTLMPHRATLRHTLLTLGIGLTILSATTAHADDSGTLQYQGVHQGKAAFPSVDCSIVGQKLETLMAPHQDGKKDGAGPYLAYTGKTLIFRLGNNDEALDKTFMRMGSDEGISLSRINGHWAVTLQNLKLPDAEYPKPRSVTLNGTLICSDTVDMPSATSDRQPDAAQPTPSQGPFRTLPSNAWRTVNAAQGIQIGSGQATPQLVVIFDPNNPYDAWLYRHLRDEHPNLVVRWVPVAYLGKDSAAMAAALLAAHDPGAALDQNFRQFDKHANHGGYTVPAGFHESLSARNQKLLDKVSTWGGGTPMMIWPTKDGRILVAMGASRKTLQQVVAAIPQTTPRTIDMARPDMPKISDKVDFKARQMCQSMTTPGAKRDGCLHEYRQLLAATSGHLVYSDQQMATAMATVALQSTLALDATTRYWYGLTQWAWPTAAHQSPFFAVSPRFGTEMPVKKPRHLDCPGGGSLGLIDNGGGAEELHSHHRLPNVTVGFSSNCRIQANGPAATAVTPSVQYGSAFQTADGKAQTRPDPVYLMLNSQPRLDTMPAWIPQGRAGVLRADGKRLLLYGDTPKEGDNQFDFTAWPKSAHRLKHKPYAGVSLQTDAKVPGLQVGDCIDDGRRCLMLDTDLDKPDRIVAHFRLGGSLATSPVPVPPALRPFLMSVNTTQPLTLSGEGPGMIWRKGELTLHSGHRAHQANPTIDLWTISMRPETINGTQMVHIDWTRGEGSKARHGAADLPQTALVRMPHYCTKGERNWSCVDPGYDPDWSD